MTTSISSERLAAHRRYVAEREAQRQSALAERKAHALVAAREAAAILKDQFGARRVILYGSLAHGSWWREHSDVDLAAEGIAPDVFWRAWGAVERLAPGIEINLAPLETVKTAVLQRIEQEGIEL